MKREGEAVASEVVEVMGVLLGVTLARGWRREEAELLRERVSTRMIVGLAVGRGGMTGFPLPKPALGIAMVEVEASLATPDEITTEEAIESRSPPGASGERESTIME